MPACGGWGRGGASARWQGTCDLSSAFRQHREQTQTHLRRLEQILDAMGEKTRGEPCKGIRGIIEEGEPLLGGSTDGVARDAALISSAQRIEHYEMALYGALRTYARQLGRDEDARLLQKTLDEEGKADHDLTRLAESRVNEDATA